MQYGLSQVCVIFIELLHGLPIRKQHFKLRNSFAAKESHCHVHIVRANLGQNSGAFRQSADEFPAVIYQIMNIAWLNGLHCALKKFGQPWMSKSPLLQFTVCEIRISKQFDVIPWVWEKLRWKPLDDSSRRWRNSAGVINEVAAPLGEIRAFQESHVTELQISARKRFFQVKVKVAVLLVLVEVFPLSCVMLYSW